MLNHLRYMAAAVILVGLIAPPIRAQDSGHSLRFFGNGKDDIDRVKIPLDAPKPAADVSGDFTIEFWMKVNPDENGSGACTTGDATWINGNIILDRDVFGGGDYGDYGLSLFAEDGVISFGVSRGDTGTTLCGTTRVIDEMWHHIAVTRDSVTGRMALYIDGRLDVSANGPTGDISYRDGRATEWPNDPFLVIGAEKHDYDNTQYPSYSGWMDELRISTVVRYLDDFVPSNEPFTTDDDTVLLFHFDEGSGNHVEDSSGTESHGERREGGNPPGPEWSVETPFQPGEDPPAEVTPAS